MFPDGQGACDIFLSGGIVRGCGCLLSGGLGSFCFRSGCFSVLSVDGAGAVDDELPQAVRPPARRAVHVNSARTFFPFIMNPPYICCNLEIMYPIYFLKYKAINFPMIVSY